MLYVFFGLDVGDPEIYSCVIVGASNAHDPDDGWYSNRCLLISKTEVDADSPCFDLSILCVNAKPLAAVPDDHDVAFHAITAAANVAPVASR